MTFPIQLGYMKWVVDFGDSQGILEVENLTTTTSFMVRQATTKLTDPNPERRKLNVSIWKQKRATAVMEAGYDEAVRGSGKRRN